MENHGDLAGDGHRHLHSDSLEEFHPQALKDDHVFVREDGVALVEPADGVEQQLSAGLGEREIAKAHPR